MPHAIYVEQLTKIFRPPGGLTRWLSASPVSREITALRNVSFEVENGEIFGLLGSNGAGKTTLLKILATLVRPDSGQARVCGYDVVRDEARVRERIGLVCSDERSFYWRLTGRENLRFFGSLMNVRSSLLSSRIEDLSAALDMGDFLGRRYDTYSAGMKQRLAVARGLLGDPGILLMDEPTRGLDPISAGNLLQTARRLADNRGTAIVMVTHRLAEAENICDRIGILHSGRMERVGTVSELCDSAKSAGTYTFHVKSPPSLASTEMKNLPWVRTLWCRDERLEVQIEEPEQHLAELLGYMMEKGYKISHIAPKYSELDEVYLDALREEAV